MGRASDAAGSADNPPVEAMPTVYSLGARQGWSGAQWGEPRNSLCEPTYRSTITRRGCRRLLGETRTCRHSVRKCREMLRSQHLIARRAFGDQFPERIGLLPKVVGLTQKFLSVPAGVCIAHMAGHAPEKDDPLFEGSRRDPQ